MKENSLSGQVAIVTGAGSGIGRGIALALGTAGAAVAVNYHSNADEGQAVVDKITAAGGRAVAIGADVSREADVQALFARTEETLGPPQILVNNAGIEDDHPFLELTLKDWQRVMDVNLTGYFLCAREAAKAFLRNEGTGSGARGKMIFISSVHDRIPWTGHIAYTASKGGVMLMMQSIAQELAPQRIRVNSISPGAIRTSINQQVWGTAEGMAGLLQLIPYGRIGEPEDIGRAAVWLASDDSDYITGATLYVDGGMTLYPGFMHGG